MTPDQLAKACADKLWGPDTCSQWLGMELLEVRPGYARIRMKVRPEFLNGHGICHGGLMFTLADSTFAFACPPRGGWVRACDALSTSQMVQLVDKIRYRFDVNITSCNDIIMI